MHWHSSGLSFHFTVQWSFTLSQTISRVHCISFQTREVLHLHSHFNTKAFKIIFNVRFPAAALHPLDWNGSEGAIIFHNAVVCSPEILWARSSVGDTLLHWLQWFYDDVYPLKISPIEFNGAVPIYSSWGSGPVYSHLGSQGSAWLLHECTAVGRVKGAFFATSYASCKVCWGGIVEAQSTCDSLLC